MNTWLAIRTEYSTCTIGNQLPQGKIEQKVGHFEFNYRGPEIRIEQQDALNEIGLGNRTKLITDDYYQAKRKVLQCIARMAQEGDRFVAEMQRQDTGATLAKEKSRQKVPEINVQALPKTPPNITFEYSVDINWLPGEANIEIYTSPPQINWNKGYVAITVQTGNEIDIKG